MDHHNKQENCAKNGVFLPVNRKKKIERCLRVTPRPPNQTQWTIKCAYLHHNGKRPFGGRKMCQKTGLKQCVSCSFNTAWTVRCLDRLLNNQLLTLQTINYGRLHHNMPQNWGKKVHSRPFTLNNEVPWPESLRLHWRCNTTVRHWWKL